MPSEMYENLPVEKKKRILLAAKNEFTRVILPKALVSNIVKDAGISRGSFYDYFESLEDLFIYLIKKIYSRGDKCFSRFYLESGNDYFKALKLHYKHILGIFGTPENRQFNLNVFASLSLLNAEAKSSFTQFPILEFEKDYQNSSYLEEYNLDGNKSEFFELLDLVKWNSIYHYLSNEISEEDSLIKYSNYIDLVSKIIK